jgi:hypothetical protein
MGRQAYLQGERCLTSASLDGQEPFYVTAQFLGCKGLPQKMGGGWEFMMDHELAGVLLGNVQYGQLRIPGSEALCHLHSIGCGQHRFYHQQINGAVMVFHNVTDILGGAGFENRVTFQPQNFPKNRPKRVVIIDK